MVRGKTVVENGEHVSLSRHDAVAASDELQSTLLEEVGAQKFVRMRSPYTWVDG